MAGADLKKVQRGQPLDIPSGAYNAFIDAARAHRAARHDLERQTEDTIRSTGIIRVRNLTGGDRDRFDVLMLDTPIVPPASREAEFRRRPMLDGRVPVSDPAGKQFCVLFDPIRAGKIGRAVVSGATIARVHVVDEDDRRADMAPGETGSLRSGQEGAAYILWKDAGTGVKWSVVRIGNPSAAAGQLVELCARENASRNQPYRCLRGEWDPVKTRWCYSGESPTVWAIDHRFGTLYAETDWKGLYQEMPANRTVGTPPYQQTISSIWVCVSLDCAKPPEGCTCN